MMKRREEILKNAMVISGNDMVSGMNMERLKEILSDVRIDNLLEMLEIVSGIEVLTEEGNFSRRVSLYTKTTRGADIRCGRRSDRGSVIFLYRKPYCQPETIVATGKGVAMVNTYIVGKLHESTKRLPYQSTHRPTNKANKSDITKKYTDADFAN